VEARAGRFDPRFRAEFYGPNGDERCIGMAAAIMEIFDTAREQGEPTSKNI